MFVNCMEQWFKGTLSASDSLSVCVSLCRTFITSNSTASEEKKCNKALPVKRVISFVSLLWKCNHTKADNKTKGTITPNGQ